MASISASAISSARRRAFLRREFFSKANAAKAALTTGRTMSTKRIGIGPRMSKAVVHGDTVYLSGTVAEKAKGKSVGEQTQEILGLIEAILAEAGTDKTKILSVNIWLTDIKTFAEMNAVWDAWVVQGHTPARATVEAKLASPQYNVEIACIAAR
jgi:enamine deaminase RidA (YjgF/YER057c/UK114 family)